MAVLEINLAKIRQNTANLVKALGNIELVGVIKACQGNAAVAQAFVEGGVHTLADVHLQNFKALKSLPVKKMLLRAPLIGEDKSLLSQIDYAIVSNVEDIKRLKEWPVSLETGYMGLLTNIETGFGREGFKPSEIEKAIKAIKKLRGTYIAGYATNTACNNGTNPLGQLSYFTSVVSKAEGWRGGGLPRRAHRSNSRVHGRETAATGPRGIEKAIISGGNSSVLPWALKKEIPQEINQLRIGEAILLGHDTVSYKAIANNSLDSFRLKVEVVEERLKNGNKQAVLATGIQDIGAGTLKFISRESIKIERVFSNCLTVTAKKQVNFGKSIWFRPDYYALLALMTSPYVKKRFIV